LDQFLQLNSAVAESVLRRSYHEMGANRFLKERLEPFLDFCQRLEKQGKLASYQRKFAELCIRDLLIKKWRVMSGRASGEELVVLASFCGQTPEVKMQMTALMVSLFQDEVLFLGRG